MRLGASVLELWRAREQVRSLSEREIRARYKQAVLGFAWAIITPVLLMIVFTLFFKRAANPKTGDIPYTLFAYIGLLPWSFFSSSVSRGGQSLIGNSNLLNKVYCPREVFPLSSVAEAAVDNAISVSVLGVLFGIHAFAPTATAVWVPLLLLVQLAFTVGVTLVVSVVIVYLRDLRLALPIILQVGLFATPVAYPIDVVPESLRQAYAAVNPLAPVIDGYRRTVLLGKAPDWDLFVPGALAALFVLVAGYWLFKRLETGIADVA